MTQIGLPLMPDGSATAHLYLPKLATVLADGYGFDSFRKDVMAALTVARCYAVYTWPEPNLSSFRP
jgi:hypothetical protein